MKLYWRKCVIFDVPPLEIMGAVFHRPGKENAMPVSDAQKKASVKYLGKLDEVRIRMPKGQKEIIKAHAAACGQSVNAYINRAIDRQMERDREGGEGNE